MAIISEKTKKFITGRIGQMSRIRTACKNEKNIIWVHAASYGEFEEARPVIQQIRKMEPQVKILATFFSPSGYEFLKNDPIADWVFYLPLDTTFNARQFLETVHPVKAIFSISDYWPHFLLELRRRKTDTYLISARFISSMIYFKPAGFIYRWLFKNCFKKIMVSNSPSLELLQSIGIKQSMLIGDPRLDRAMDIASQAWNDKVIDSWCEGRKVFVAGSTLPIGDDAVLTELANRHPDDKFLIVPHEIDEKEIADIKSSIKGKTALYTEGEEAAKGAQVMIVNTVGILSKIYRYGFASYVGAGFDGGPHSIIEPAAYGIPVSYGPEFGCYHHCQALIDAGGGHSISNADELCQWYDRLVNDKEYLEACSKAALEYCKNGGGTAEKIAREIMED